MAQLYNIALVLDWRWHGVAVGSRRAPLAADMNESDWATRDANDARHVAGNGITPRGAGGQLAQMKNNRLLREAALACQLCMGGAR